MTVWKLGTLCALGSLLWAQAPVDSSALFAALRNGNTAAVKSLAGRKIDVDARNAEGETPLMYAAQFGSAETLKLLLARGADPNAKTPAGTTALMLAAGDLEKERALVDKGADVNAQSATGRTALLIAASRSASGEVVGFLVAHGADVNAKDKLQGIPLVPAGAGGSTPLIEAAKIRDGQALRVLLAKRADVQAKDNSGADALAAAALHGNRENVELLLARGARVDARVTPAQLTPLMFAAWRQDARLAQLLIAHGAEVDATDMGGNTALMWSAYSDYAEPETTRVLIDAGAKVRVWNNAHETPMVWARRRGDTAIVKLLLARGAQDVPAPVAPVTPTMTVKADRAAIDAAVTKSLAALQQSSPQFVKVSGCVSCHNQSLPQIAIAQARRLNIHVDEKLSDQMRKQVMGMVKPAKLPLLEMADVVPDTVITGPYLLLGMAADDYAPDTYTDAVVTNIAGKQSADGSWKPWGPRPPVEFSDVTATALSIRMLQIYGAPANQAEWKTRIGAAREWLRVVKPRTNEERAMRLLGLKWSGAPEAEIAAAARSLKWSQRPGGGWAQLDGLEPDAYATGQAMYALRTAGGMAANDAAYLRGVDYLMSTQEADGSWHVATRSFALQPYKESGFPHGKDQWISAAGTSWASLALLQRAEPVLTAKEQSK
jgi:ankyrin repeat protein